ncbi:hypothetical protein [Peptoniphilus sp. BV3AC2]|uniref:hypothetical protein n=1 Tax=Peptoniphilus sp. BV3AC2 TaxID=1111133 RepID=UPI0003B89007|nr:hypothetical protein [Peptoniphilus sp. BV3AC2]ERT62636.1 putative lipoprotein [Peptoniphilus sp. BV3AC2]
MKKSILILMAAIMVVFTACSKSDTKTSEVDKTYPPMVKVDGTTYTDTGYENAMVTCGTADGEIKTSVDGKSMPENNDESNFGTGYGYQVWEKGYINVEIEGRWILFRDVELKDDGQIPKWVAHFTAKVINTEEDSIMVEATEIEDGFYFKDLLTKPISLSIENLKNEKDGKTTTEGLEGKTVEVYFGGEIKNTEPESSVPINLEKIYRIEVK